MENFGIFEEGQEEEEEGGDEGEDDYAEDA